MNIFGDTPISQNNSDNTVSVQGEGGNAYWDDVKLKDNPYAPGDSRHKLWEEGWKQAQHEVMNPERD